MQKRQVIWSLLIFKDFYLRFISVCKYVVRPLVQKVRFGLNEGAFFCYTYSSIGHDYIIYSDGSINYGFIN